MPQILENFETKLGEQYDESNDLMICQIKRKIALIPQESLSVTTYYSKLK